MIRYYTNKNKVVVEVDNIQPSSWINIEPPFTAQEIEEIAELLDIPLDFLTDSLDVDERSRYEREEEVKLIVLNTPLINKVDKENEAIYFTAPIGIILLPEYIVTITAFENPIINKFVENRVKNFASADKEMFVLQIFEQTVYRYLECLKKLNSKRNLIEKELYNSSKNRELQQLLRIEKSLVYFVNSLSTNELLKLKMKRSDLLNIRGKEKHEDLFEDIIIDNSQALEMSNVYTNILSSTMEAYTSIISNNMNVFIHRLTVITIVLMVPTLVASFFGMNVPLPFQNNQYAFLIIVFFTFLFGVMLMWFFKKKDLF